MKPESKGLLQSIAKSIVWQMKPHDSAYISKVYEEIYTYVNYHFSYAEEIGVKPELVHHILEYINIHSDAPWYGDISAGVSSFRVKFDTLFELATNDSDLNEKTVLYLDFLKRNLKT